MATKYFGNRDIHYRPVGSYAFCGKSYQELRKSIPEGQVGKRLFRTDIREVTCSACLQKVIEVCQESLGDPDKEPCACCGALYPKEDLFPCRACLQEFCVNCCRILPTDDDSAGSFICCTACANIPADEDCI